MFYRNCNIRPRRVHRSDPEILPREDSAPVFERRRISKIPLADLRKIKITRCVSEIQPELQRDIIDPEEIVVTHKDGEGEIPIFDRPELMNTKISSSSHRRPPSNRRSSRNSRRKSSREPSRDRRSDDRSRSRDRCRSYERRSRDYRRHPSSSGGCRHRDECHCCCRNDHRSPDKYEPHNSERRQIPHYQESQLHSNVNLCYVGLTGIILGYPPTNAAYYGYAFQPGHPAAWTN